MALPVLLTALRILGTLRTVATLLEMVNGPKATTTVEGNCTLPILPEHHAYIKQQYNEAVDWNDSHPPALHITYGALTEGLNRELGLSQSWKAYQKVWSRPLQSPRSSNERS